jgi:membrane protease subunit (stomatin/prohibitin family)
MSIFQSVKEESRRNFIARPDEAKDEIVYKYPERNIRIMTQLTVNSDEVVLFFKDGKVVGQLAPGRHSLDSNNVPFLSRLVERFTGGNLFVAEVFFVGTREFAGIKFGGPIGDVRDPDSGLGIGTMVYGDFSLRVSDPARLVIGLVGMGHQSNEAFLGWFRDQVLKVTRDRIAELMVKKRWPLLDITSGAYTEEIETEVLAGVKAHVDSYGVQIARMGNFVVSIKEEDEAALKRLSKDAAYSKLAGGFQNYAQGQALLGAAEGMSKGGEGGGAALQGMGFGVGFGMANAAVNARGGSGPAGSPGGAVCAKCGTTGLGKFCASCGSPLAMAAAAHCMGCGAEMISGARFCSNCGKAATAV